MGREKYSDPSRSEQENQLAARGSFEPIQTIFDEIGPIQEYKLSESSVGVGSSAGGGGSGTTLTGITEEYVVCVNGEPEPRFFFVLPAQEEEEEEPT